jgi:poly(3-hydroxybutyrate) depolymerase
MISGQLSTEMRHPAFHLRPTRRDPRCQLPSQASAQYASFNDSTNGPEIFKLTHYTSQRRLLEHVSQDALVEYYRCDECGHIWTHEKANPNSSPKMVTVKAARPHPSS